MSPLSESDRSIESLPALVEAVGIAGGEASLARQINAARLPMPRATPKGSSHVSKWKARGACPPDMVLRIEAATGVSRHRLRPDVFGYEPIDPPQQLREAAE
jgi:DNA-binding transcriptional regulator YdaS (Cro superfamily)